MFLKVDLLEDPIIIASVICHTLAKVLIMLNGDVLPFKGGVRSGIEYIAVSNGIAFLDQTFLDRFCIVYSAVTGYSCLRFPPNRSIILYHSKPNSFCANVHSLHVLSFDWPPY